MCSTLCCIAQTCSTFTFWDRPENLKLKEKETFKDKTSALIKKKSFVDSSYPSFPQVVLEFFSCFFKQLEKMFQAQIF